MHVGPNGCLIVPYVKLAPNQVHPSSSSVRPVRGGAAVAHADIISCNTKKINPSGTGEKHGETVPIY